jgi:hypothetical protein
MSTSVRYEEMSKELDRVRNSLLPSSFNPIGLYSDQEITQARAFVVLAHAEFESFIEDRVKWCAESAVKLWTNNGLMSLALVHLSVYLASELKEDFKWKDTNKKFEAILAVLMGKVQNNHGVKNANLKNLLKPIGIDLTDIPVLAPELESFGVSRGNVAHTSGGAQTTKAIDPSSQHDVVFKKILPELKALDILISEKCLPNQQATLRPAWYARVLQWIVRKFA